MSEESKSQGFTITDRRGQDATENSPPHPAEPASESKAQAENKTERTDQHLYEVSFTTFIMSLSTSAIVSMGEIPDPTTGLVETNVAHAKQIIDILGILRDKTNGNLQKEEESLLNGMLYDLRMRYLQKTNQIKL